MNRRKVSEMVKFAVYTNMKNKWFIIFNVISLIVAVTAFNWGHFSSLFQNEKDDDAFTIAMLDENNLIFDTFANHFSGDSNYVVMRITENTYTAENISDKLMMIEVIPDEKECFRVKIVSKEGINVKIYNPIADELYAIRNTLYQERYQLGEDMLSLLQSELSVDRVMLGVDAENSDMKNLIKSAAAFFTYFLTIFIFSKMANEIASEKQSKSTEYILTTVSEKEYLFAKIFSNILLMIIQGLFLIVYYYIAIVIAQLWKGVVSDISLRDTLALGSIPSEIIGYILSVLIYNILNCILLCILQAALAAKTSSTQEAGNSVSLLMTVIVIGYALTEAVISPYAKATAGIYILSCIPIFSAFFVPAMMAIGQANVWQIIVSLAILVLSIPVSFQFCARIFKNGILDYTKIRQKKKAEKTPEEQRRIFIVKRNMQKFGFVIGLSIIIYVGIQTVVSLLGSIILTAFVGSILTETDMTLLLQIILQLTSLGLAYWLVSNYTDKKKISIEKRAISGKQKGIIILMALFAVFILQIFLSLVLYPWIGLDYNTTDLFDVNANSSLFSKIVLILSIAVTPAIMEELFFRKAVINFSSQYGKKFALIFSALFFGLLHMNLSQGIFAFVMGIILGSIYLYTGDIRLTMLIHFLNNGFAALELVVPETYTVALRACLLLVMITGLWALIRTFTQKETRARLVRICREKVNIQAFEEKYQYIFTDYTFDVSLLLIFLMSIVTEQILR